jgi:ribose transport system substrate-binding protein
MTESVPAETKRRRKTGLLLGAGAVLLVALAYIAWLQGAFKTQERIALISGGDSPFWQPVRAGAEDAAKEFGVKLTFVMSPADDAAQNKSLQDLVADGVQGVAISPNNPVAQADALNNAADKTVLITFDSDAPKSKRRGFVGTNDYAAGEIAGEQVREALPNGCVVLILTRSVDKTNGRDRRQGLIDDLLERPYSPERQYDALDAALRGKSYSIAATLVDGGDEAKAAQMVATALKDHPEVKCVVGLFAYSGPAIAKGVEAAGKKGQVKIIGFDESLEEQALVSSGVIYSSILQDQYRCGYETVRMLADMLRGTDQGGYTGLRVYEMRVLVMKADNIAELQRQHAIRITK